MFSTLHIPPVVYELFFLNIIGGMRSEVYVDKLLEMIRNKLEPDRNFLIVYLMFSRAYLLRH